MFNDHRTTLLTISSALLAVAPKCPICFLAYFGIFGVATATASAYRVWLAPITAVWLALTVTVVAIRTDRRRGSGSFVLAIAAALSVFAGKFIVESQLMVYAGIASLIVAAVWSSWSRTPMVSASCSQCEPQPLTDKQTEAGS